METELFIAGIIVAGGIIVWATICAHADLLARTRPKRTETKREGFDVRKILN